MTLRELEKLELTSTQISMLKPYEFILKRIIIRDFNLSPKEYDELTKIYCLITGISNFTSSCCRNNLHIIKLANLYFNRLNDTSIEKTVKQHFIRKMINFLNK